MRGRWPGRRGGPLRHGNAWQVDQHYFAILEKVAAYWGFELRYDQPLIDRLTWDEDWGWPEPRPDEEPTAG